MITASEKPKEVTQYWSCCGYAAWKGELKCNESCVKTGVRMVRATDFDTLTRETADLRREVEGMRKDAARRIELARNEGFREGWMRCGAYHIDVCFESPDEHAEVDRRLAALAATRKGETT